VYPRIVACIYDSVWIQEVLEDEPEMGKFMTKVMTETGDLEVTLEVDFD
jgi:hypothetical protein